MKISFRSMGALLATLIVLFNGCSVFLRTDLKDRKESEIWEVVRKNSGVVRDFYAHADLTIESGFRSIPVDIKIYFLFPDWLTFRAYGPMNLKLVEASLQKNRFQVYSLFTSEFFSGNLDSVKIGSRFKLPLPELDIRNAWQRVFNPQQPEEKLGEIRKSGKYYILTYRLENGFREIWIDGRKMLIYRENTLDSDGALKYYLSYYRYKRKDGVRFPSLIEMGDIDQGVKISIETKKFEVNSNIAESDMILSVPPEVKRIELKAANQISGN